MANWGKYVRKYGLEWGLDGRSRRCYLFFQMQEMWVHLYAGKKTASRGQDWWYKDQTVLIDQVVAQRRWEERKFKGGIQRPPPQWLPGTSSSRKKKGGCGEGRWGTRAQGCVVSSRQSWNRIHASPQLVWSIMPSFLYFSSWKWPKCFIYTKMNHKEYLIFQFRNGSSIVHFILSS